MTIDDQQLDYDVFVIGGGINGAGIAYDAAGRGLRVCLCDMGDLAGATSSASSKLIHGGLRYLEQFEFRLVKEALAEREVILNIAPHIATPLRFRLPHQPSMRPMWMIQIGIALYDNLSKRTYLPASKKINLVPTQPLKSNYVHAFEYSDVWIDDARLVVLNAQGAQQHGAHILTRTKVISAHRVNAHWQVQIQDLLTNQRKIVTAKAVVNAAGPWVSNVLTSLGAQSKKKIRMVQGSHIVVKKLYDEHVAYILQNDDSRIVFILPFLDKFSLIGTTDIDYQGNPAEVSCSDKEKLYLCDVVNRYLFKGIKTKDIVWHYSGVRPLHEETEQSNASTVTRDYAFEIEGSESHGVLLTVFGGKLTTYRKLSEHALDQLTPYFANAKGAWTKETKLPGADKPMVCAMNLAEQYPWLPQSLLQRYVTSYGKLTEQFLMGCEALEDLGTCFGAEIYQREVDYLMAHEWVYEVDDLLWRRSKLGLFLPADKVKALSAYISKRQATVRKKYDQARLAVFV